MTPRIHRTGHRGKVFITLVVCGYTWATYVAGALFAPSEPGVEQHFGLSPEASELGLSLYVLAYGVGPMVFGPLTERIFLLFHYLLCLELSYRSHQRFWRASSTLLLPRILF